MKQKIVFIGDSITWGWKSEEDKLGTGYVRLLHDYLKVTFPDRHLEIVNNGVSGDRVIDLAQRWEKDVFSLNPDIVSISIGINDVARQFDSPDLEQMIPERFEEVYESLLTCLNDKARASIVLMEPTVLKEDAQSEGNQKLADYVGIIHRLAGTYKATVVPTHEAFLNYLSHGSCQPLTIDGVHMNGLGNMLMAKTWIKAAERLIEEAPL